MSSTTFAVLKITLDQVKPPVLRRVEVPFDIRLDRLHLVIQAAMGRTNSHLYEIRAGDVGWSTPYDDDPLPNDVLDARKARLGRVIKHAETKKLTYLYDFGDGWKHSVRIERLADPLPGVAYPRLTEAVGRCPPEDVGGPGGYAEFLEAIADPKHARHAELTEWIAEDFDPNDVPTKWLADEVAELAESWSRPPRVRQARSA